MSLSMGVPGRGSGGTRRGRFKGLVRLMAVGLLTLLATGLGGCGGGSGDVGLGFSYPEFPSFPSKAPIRVPQEVATISEAVDSASPGDTILVSPGVYKETVTVRCSDLQIVGTDRDTVILEALPETGAIAIGSGIQNVRIATMTIRPDPNTPTEPLAEAPRVTSSSQETRENLLARDWPMVDISAIALSQYLSEIASRPVISLVLPNPLTTLIHTSENASVQGIWVENLSLGALLEDQAFFTMGIDLNGVSGLVVRNCSFQGMYVGVGLNESDGVIGDCSFNSLQCGVLATESPKSITLYGNVIGTSSSSSVQPGRFGFLAMSIPVEVLNNEINVDPTNATETAGAFLYDCPQVTVTGNQIRVAQASVIPDAAQVSGLSVASAGQVDVRDNMINVQGFASHRAINGAILSDCSSGSVSANTFVTDCPLTAETVDSAPLQTSVMMLGSDVIFSNNVLWSGPVSINLLADSSPSEFRENAFHVAPSGYGLELGNSGALVIGNTFMGDDPAWGAIRSLTPQGKDPIELQVRENIIDLRSVFGIYAYDPGATLVCSNNEVRIESPGSESVLTSGIYAGGQRNCTLMDNHVSILGDGNGWGIAALLCNADILGNVVSSDVRLLKGIMAGSPDATQEQYVVQIRGNSVDGEILSGISCLGNVKFDCRENVVALQPGSGHEEPPLFDVTGIEIILGEGVCSKNSVGIRGATNGHGMFVTGTGCDVAENNVEASGALSAGIYFTNLYSGSVEFKPANVQSNRVEVSGARCGIDCYGPGLECRGNVLEMSAPEGLEMIAPVYGIQITDGGTCAGNSVILAGGFHEGGGISFVGDGECSANQVVLAGTLSWGTGIEAWLGVVRLEANDIRVDGPVSPGGILNGLVLYLSSGDIVGNSIGEGGGLTHGIGVIPHWSLSSVSVRQNSALAHEYALKILDGPVRVECTENVLVARPVDPGVQAFVSAVQLVDVDFFSLRRNRIAASGAQSYAIDQNGSILEASNNLLAGEYFAAGIWPGVSGDEPTTLLHNNVLTGGSGGVLVGGQKPSTGLRIFSNIILSQLYGLAATGGGQAILADFNSIVAPRAHVGLLPGPNDMFVDPQFVDTVDYRLQPGSPCIDAGVEDPTYNDVTPPGQGTARNDMGAYGGPMAGDIPKHGSPTLRAAFDVCMQPNLRFSSGTQGLDVPVKPALGEDVKVARARLERNLRAIRRRQEGNSLKTTQMGERILEQALSGEEICRKSLPRSKRGAL